MPIIVPSFIVPWTKKPKLEPIAELNPNLKPVVELVPEVSKCDTHFLSMESFRCDIPSGPNKFQIFPKCMELA